MTTSISDVPREVLRLIAGNHLHTAVDAVRFHAVSKSWRNTLHHLPRQRPLLPWLLAPSSPSSSSSGIATAGGPCRCVFSKTSYHAAPGAAAHARGTASWFVDGLFVNPLTGLPEPDHGADHQLYGWEWITNRYSHFVFSRDSTFLAYSLTSSSSSLLLTGITWAPNDGDIEDYVSITLGGPDTERFIASAFHGGATVCVDLVNCYVFVHENGLDRATYLPLPDEPPGIVRRRSYLLELGGELLLASVLQDDGDRLSVSVHAFDLVAAMNALEQDHDGEPPMPVWEKRDGGDLGDHVLFLGFPGSFAVEAARFGGELPGSSAYFVVRSEPCRVYRCSIQDDGGTAAPAATLVDTLPAGWNDERCMWFMPEPDIDPLRPSARDTPLLEKATLLPIKNPF